MDERYSVYFDGQVIAGHDVNSVREKLAKVFNADQPTLDKLFSGKLQLIKRGCDAATAQKYKTAMERAGAVPVIKPETPATAAAPSPARPMTAAERIAALAAAPDETRFRQSSAAPAESAEAESAAGGIALTPAGTEVLRAHERATPVVRDVDTSGLAVDSASARLSDIPPPPPAAPDTNHLSMGDVGERIPNLESGLETIFPDLEGLELSAPGTDFSDCAAPDPQAPVLDVSGLTALPPGTLPLEEQQRQQHLPVPVPSTDHLSIKD